MKRVHSTVYNIQCIIQTVDIYVVKRVQSVLHTMQYMYVRMYIQHSKVHNSTVHYTVQCIYVCSREYTCSAYYAVHT